MHCEGIDISETSIFVGLSLKRCKIAPTRNSVMQCGKKDSGSACFGLDWRAYSITARTPISHLAQRMGGTDAETQIQEIDRNS